MKVMSAWLSVIILSTIGSLVLMFAAVNFNSYRSKLDNTLENNVERFKHIHKRTARDIRAVTSHTRGINISTSIVHSEPRNTPLVKRTDPSQKSNASLLQSWVATRQNVPVGINEVPKTVAKVATVQHNSINTNHKNSLGIGEVVRTASNSTPVERDAFNVNRRIFCWILTTPNNTATRAVAVKETWANRCDKHIFYSSEENKTIPTVKLDANEGRQHLVDKYWKAYLHSYDNFFDDFDWFLKVDDDTYVIVENVRNMVSRYDTRKPLVFGYKFEANVTGGYMSGGAGILFSKEAYRKLVVDGIKGKRCKPQTKSADVETGRCLNALGVTQGVSVDSQGRQTFHPLPPDFHLIGKFPDWMSRISFHKLRQGIGCCSKETISFHYVKPEMMYVLHFLIYELAVHDRSISQDQTVLGAPFTHAPPRGKRNNNSRKEPIAMKFLKNNRPVN